MYGLLDRPSPERADEEVRLIRRLLWAIVVAGIAVLGVASGAVGAQESGESLQGFVRNELNEGGKVTRVPVADVQLLVLTSTGETVGTATTDALGRYELPLPGPGDYTVRIDQGTLPEGVELRDKAQEDLVVNIRPSETQILNYFLGKSARHTESRWEQLPQSLANGVRFGLIIAITAVGLSLIYGTTGLSNFSHGELVTLGAVVAWWMNQSVGLHLLVAIPIGVAAGALGGFVSEAGIWRPLRRRGVSLTSMMIVSIGLGLTARYVFLYTFGGRSRAYRQYAVQEAVSIGPVDLTKRDLITMAVCVIVLLGVALFLQRSRHGKAIRAVSDNPELASATGINTNRVILLVWVAGGALAGLGGIMLGLSEQVRWNMGFTMLLLMFAAITVGGLGNPYGALAGALLVGVAVELFPWIFPSAVELKNTGALITLIIVLLVRPQGLLGRKERVG
jgi:branched-chain amino acid transport system permease protein